jgi:hypothetical protein
MATVTIACAVPGGLIIGTDAFNNPIKLNGPNASGVNYETNEVWVSPWLMRPLGATR